MSRKCSPELALGTVQFGLAYGVAGRGEVVPENEVRAILEDAAGRGVRTLDTAAAYGDIEGRLARLCEGLPFKIASKIPAIPASMTPSEAAAFALEVAEQSRARLGPRLHALMVHQHSDLQGPRGQALSEALRRWTDFEQVLFGASCYSPVEALELHALQKIAITQIPANALDQRILKASEAAFSTMEVHVRSVFLQGLLLMPFESALRRVPAAEPSLLQWHAHCRTHGASPLQAALGAVKSFPSVSAVVVGVDTLAQWREIADAWQTTPPLPCPSLDCELASVIDPRQWNLAAKAH